MTRDAALAHLETYLVQVRRRLHALPAAEADEVIQELRSHVLDRVEGEPTPRSMEAALEALGSPADVARLNVTERAAALVGASSAPLRVLRALYRVATVSVLGVFTFFVSLFGYSLSAAFLALAVLKPIAPDTVGLWWRNNPGGEPDFVFGSVDPAPGWQDSLGYGLIPISLVLGLSLGYLTWRLSAGAVRMMARSAWRARRTEVESSAAFV